MGLTVNQHEHNEDMARLAEQEAMGLRAGFAFRPTVRTLGDRVIDVGQDNYRRSREEWEEQPLIPDLVRDFRAEIAKEDRADSMPKRLTEFEMAPDGAIVNGGGARLALNPHSLRQLIYRTGFAQPSAAATYLAEIPPDRRAREVNALLRAAPDNTTAVFRTRRQPQPGPREVYAVVSESYATGCEVDEIARIVGAARWPGEARGSVVYDGQRAAIRVQWHSDVQPERVCRGEVFRAFASITSRDDGSMGIMPRIGATRNLCLNLIILDEQVRALGTKRHSGDPSALERAVEDSIQEAIGAMRDFAVTWDRARQMGLELEAVARDIPPTLTHKPTIVQGLFRGLVAEKRLALPGNRGEDVVLAFTDAWMLEPEFTLAGLVNGITRAAHTARLKGLWATEEVERQAGEILASRKPIGFQEVK